MSFSNFAKLFFVTFITAKKLEIVAGQHQNLKRIPALSNDTVQRRIDKMSFDVLNQLVEILSLSKHSLQIDESTLVEYRANLTLRTSGSQRRHAPRSGA